MKKFFADNWFKKWLLIFVFLALCIAAYHQFLETKKHNLDVINSVRLCAGLNSSLISSCADAVKKEYIPSKSVDISKLDLSALNI